MFNNRAMKIGLFCSLGLAGIMLLVLRVGGIVFVVIMMVVMCALMNLYAGSRKENRKRIKEMNSYVRRNIDKPVYYHDSRTNALRKEVVADGILDDIKYDRIRRILEKELKEEEQIDDEGTINERNES